MNQRVVFLDFIRVFACLLVIVVHASENFYGVTGLGSMAGPQSFLESEADRLWVSVYDGFARMSVPLFIIVSAYLLVPLKEGQSMWQFYKRRAERVLLPFACFMVLYSVLPLLWGGTDAATAIADLKYTIATEDCATRNLLQTNTRDIIDSQNAGTRAILDFLVNEKMAAKDATIADLRMQVSQSNQNNYLAATIDAAKAELIRRTGHDYPVASYLVQPPTPINFPLNGCGTVQFGGNYGGCCNGGYTT